MSWSYAHSAQRVGAQFGAVLCCLLGLGVRAQHFETTIYTESDGMPSSTAWDMVQDARGELWVVTRQGLASFDGVEWREHPGPDDIDNTMIRQIETDASGTFWLATNKIYFPLLTYDGETWQTLPPPPRVEVDPNDTSRLALRETPDGTQAALVLDGRLFFYQLGQWSYQADQLTGIGRVRDVRAVDDGFLLACSNGAYHTDGVAYRSLLSADVPPEDVDILALTPALEDDALWLLGKTWIARIDHGRYRRIRPTPDIYRPNLENTHLIYADDNGDILFGNRAHLIHMETAGARVTRWGPYTGLADVGTTHIFKGRENGLWISGTRGLTRIHNRRFINYGKSDNLPRTEVTALWEYAPGRFLLGHNEGASVYDGNGFRPLNLPGNADKGRIMEIKGFDDGSLYLTSLNTGVVALDADLQGTILPSETRVQSLYTMDRDADGKLWAGGPNGLHEYQDGIFKLYADGLSPSLRIRRVQRQPRGLTLATYHQGVFLREGDWKQYTSDLPNGNSIYTVLTDSNGRILVGSQGGLQELKGNTLSTCEDMPVSRPVYFILEDSRGRHWIGTANGIYRFGHGQTRHYTPENGLSGLETNRAAALEARDGTFWFGTSGGLSHYREAFDYQPVQPYLEISGIGTHDRNWPLDTPLELDYRRNDLSFRIKTISMVSRNSVWISGRLDGFDHSWRPKERLYTGIVHYERLPPGTYRFRVKALAGGVWSEEAATLPIHISGPYWKRPWFLVVFGLVLIVFTYSLFDYFTSKKFSHFLQLQVDERTYELTQKNQMLEDRIQEQRKAEAEIQALNEDLEARVKQRTAQLETLQKDLVENAHYAGMAEIATSMLHNVGNVLNSISTSGFLVRETLDHSKLVSLLRANDMLRRHVDDFDTYYREDPKARDLLKFYLSVGDKLEEEQQQMGTQLGLLLEKIDTIKDVVSQQHNYTSGVYQTETLSVNAMLETALKIMEASLTAKGIVIITRLDPVPDVSIQKTKMIHTLVNLLKNAAEAMAGNARRELTLISRREGDHVLLTVSDTGVGIPEENLQKIFNHGFTTKPDGHGFGLHSCANAMKEMGGDLQAANLPDGAGAVFTLRFPIPYTSDDAEGPSADQAAIALEHEQSGKDEQGQAHHRHQPGVVT